MMYENEVYPTLKKEATCYVVTNRKNEGRAKHFVCVSALYNRSGESATTIVTRLQAA